MVAFLFFVIVIFVGILITTINEQRGNVNNLSIKFNNKQRNNVSKPPIKIIHVVGLIIIISFILACFGLCSTKDDGSFLNKDPRTWTKDEQRKYNQWQDWEQKQDN